MTTLLQCLLYKMAAVSQIKSFWVGSHPSVILILIAGAGDGAV